MIDVDVARIDEHCALSFTSIQPLLAESRAQRNHVDRTKILSSTRNHELHWTESRIVLATIKRHVPQIRRAATVSPRDSFDASLIALLEIAKRTIRIGRKESNYTLIEWNRTNDESGRLESNRNLILAQRSV